MRLDAHNHFWRYAPGEFDWIDERMGRLRRDFLPPDLERESSASVIDGCIAVQARQSLAETHFLLELADRHAFIRGVVGWVDLQGERVADELDRLAAHPRLVGLRHGVQAEPDPEFMLRPAFLRGLAALESRGLAYDLLIREHQLPQATAVVSRLPRQRFVLDHLAKPRIADRILEPWARDIRELARRENVCCKLSGLVTEADWYRWSPADFEPYLDVVLDAFGPQRLMIGSDWPVCLLAGTYESALDVVLARIRTCTAADQAGMLGDNAARFYEIESGR